ncbi:Activated RNA polymerase II transcriptional coactivator p15 [Strongyloides ratti]|uniref:Activated RNA polymerase II transcriptional coactivator p15 n=1 Tax=Strongyloides ratti TaxID=34506 RepID=A0A090MXM1_STRRB|nr:Activated RNA polymerase II transcriptional coactivator p15 [Strongyloides ratti]CEF65674.1 Activated RNA polymerase II transcriptional coactivator p15 [Strongyloides ratti]
MSDSDDSFVPPEDTNPKKESKKNMKRKNESKNEEDDKKVVSSKKQKKDEGNENSAEGNFIVGKDGVKMYSLGNERYIHKSGFKGKEYINIREYYKADGELKPGKKGISLTIEQFENLKNAIPFL